MTDGREHCRSGRQPIIDQNHGAARESGRWTTSAVKFVAAIQFLRLTGHYRFNIGI